MHYYILFFFFLFFTTTIVSNQEPIFIHCSNDLYLSQTFNQLNLQILLTNLIASTPKSRLYYSYLSSFGVSGFSQCRPDATPIACTDCLLSSSSKLTTACGRSISAVLYQDICLLRYSNKNLSFSLDQTAAEFSWSWVKSSNPSDFSRRVTELMVRISWEASMATEKFAVGVVKAGDERRKKIYGMAWCVLNVTSEDCFKCLLSAVTSLPYRMEGGRIFTYTCLLRFEVYMFFDRDFIKNNALVKSGDVRNESVAAGRHGESSISRFCSKFSLELMF